MVALQEKIAAFDACTFKSCFCITSKFCCSQSTAWQITMAFNSLPCPLNSVYLNCIPLGHTTLKVKFFFWWPSGDQLFRFSRQRIFLGAKIYVNNSLNNWLTN